MNIHTLVIKNIPRLVLKIESVDGIDYRLTRLPNYLGGTHKEFPKFVKRKNCCIKIKKYDSKCFLWSIITYIHPQNVRYVDRLS